MKKYGKYTLHPGRHSYNWMALGLFRVSRWGHHSCSACPCSHSHSYKAYPGKKRIKLGREGNEWSLARPIHFLPHSAKGNAP